MTSASSIGSMGSVSIKGSLSPSSGTPFTTILCDAQGKGSFDMDVTNFQINGSSAVFTDPTAYSFSVIDESVALPADGNAIGTYKPLD